MGGGRCKGLPKGLWVFFGRHKRGELAVVERPASEGGPCDSGAGGGDTEAAVVHHPAAVDEQNWTQFLLDGFFQLITL